jgi:hypothetical protein
LKYFLIISEYNKAVVAAETDESAALIADFLFMGEGIKVIELTPDTFQSEGVIMSTNEDDAPCDEKR